MAGSASGPKSARAYAALSKLDAWPFSGVSQDPATWVDEYSSLRAATNKGTRALAFGANRAQAFNALLRVSLSLLFSAASRISAALESVGSMRSIVAAAIKRW